MERENFIVDVSIRFRVDDVWGLLRVGRISMEGLRVVWVGWIFS